MRSKLIAAAEVALFAFVLFGHDVFRWKFVPVGEVIPFVIIGSISLWLRGTGWRGIGLRRPPSWTRYILIAIAIAIGLQVVSTYITEPVMLHVFHQRENLDEFKPLIGNWKLAGLGFLIVWTFAAFGEEMVFRGYVFNRLFDLTGSNIATVVVITIFFGFGHYYQGIAGVVDASITGLTFAICYARTRNLWLTILAHGFTDTIALFLVVTNHIPTVR